MGEESIAFMIAILLQSTTFIYVSTMFGIHVLAYLSFTLL